LAEQNQKASSVSLPLLTPNRKKGSTLAANQQAYRSGGQTPFSPMEERAKLGTSTGDSILF